ncbi:MAG: DUF5333 family protein [Pseudomonadota bacterium]
MTSLRRGVVALILPFALIGCEAPGGRAATADAAARAVPEEVYEVALFAAIASGLAQDCPQLRFNEGEFRIAELELREKYGDATDLVGAVEDSPVLQARVERDGAAYIRRRGITPGDEASLCRAGSQERAERTDIARFLQPA